MDIRFSAVNLDLPLFETFTETVRVLSGQPFLQFRLFRNRQRCCQIHVDTPVQRSADLFYIPFDSEN